MNPTNEIEQKIIADIEKIASFWDAIHNKNTVFGFFKRRHLSVEEQKEVIKQVIKDNNIGKFIENAGINDMIALIKIDSHVLEHYEVRAKINGFSSAEQGQIMDATKNIDIFPNTRNKL